MKVDFKNIITPEQIKKLNDCKVKVNYHGGKAFDGILFVPQTYSKYPSLFILSNSSEFDGNVMWDRRDINGKKYNKYVPYSYSWQLMYESDCSNKASDDTRLTSWSWDLLVYGDIIENGSSIMIQKPKIKINFNI